MSQVNLHRMKFGGQRAIGQQKRSITKCGKLPNCPKTHIVLMIDLDHMGHNNKYNNINKNKT